MQGRKMTNDKKQKLAEIYQNKKSNLPISRISSKDVKKMNEQVNDKKRRFIL